MFEEQFAISIVDAMYLTEKNANNNFGIDIRPIELQFKFLKTDLSPSFTVLLNIYTKYLQY